jgi:hypothetical protein
MMGRFRIRFRLPPLVDGSQWAQMWNQISEEEAEIADQIWEGMNEENQEILRHSCVIPDLLQIMVESRGQNRWTKNPVMAMLSYAFMIKLLQPPNWTGHYLKIHNWIVSFNLHDLEPRVTDEEHQARILFLTERSGLIRRLRREHGQSH